MKKCNRSQAVGLATPSPGKIPSERTFGSSAFEVIVVDYAENREKTSYILLYAYSLSRAIHLELFPDLTAKEFIHKCPLLVEADQGKCSPIMERPS